MIFPFNHATKYQPTRKPFLSRLSPALRALLMLLIPLMLFGGPIQQQIAKATTASQPGPAAPTIAPPSNLQVVGLDSSLHITWSPSPDPNTAWHLASVWDNATLVQSKVVSRTARAAQTNGLLPDHTYTVKLYAFDALGNLSTPIQTNVSTDAQYPMRDAAFFENFNSPHGDLDPDYFDVRTSHGTGLQPESVGVEKMLVFNNENHFHTQLIGGKQRAELYLRPRVPFDFTGRTGTMQFEVDTAATQHSEGKWFEVHLVGNSSIPWSSEEFGAGNGHQLQDSIEFSVREGDGGSESDVNIPQITVNLGGVVTTYRGTPRQLTPSNIRVPVVLRVSRSGAEMLINGVSVVRASGYTLPYTRGYWMLAHRGWYSPRDLRTTPQIVQLVHWETIQYDGPVGSYNSVVGTYIQPGCGGVVRNEHGEIVGCPKTDMAPGRRTFTLNMNIPENTSLGRSAKLLYNGYASETASLNVSINGHTANVPTGTCCYQEILNTHDFPANWLRTGNNVVSFTYTGNDNAEISQVEVEVVYNQPRVMANPNHMQMDVMNMLAATGQNFRVDRLVGEPMVTSLTTNLFNLGSSTPINFNAAVISTETPWLSVSPASGTLRSPALGYGVTPLTLRIDFSRMSSTDTDGEVGVIKVTGGNMPVYIAVLGVNAGGRERPRFIESFTGVNTTFNKDAIPDYHGVNPQTPTRTRTATGVPIPTNTATRPPANCEPVAWVNTVNVTVSGNSIQKTGGTSGAWDAGAASTRAILSGNGYAQIAVDDTTSYKLFGLSNGDGGAAQSDVDFALFMAGGTLKVYESGVLKGNFGGYAVGDTLRVAVEDGVVKYYNDGLLIYTSAAPLTYPLLMDTSINSGLGRISNALICGANLGPVATATRTPTTCEAVTWTEPVNVAVTGNSIQKTGGTSGSWDAGAVSSQAIQSGDGYVQAIVDGTSTYKLFGLSNGDSNANQVDVDFALFMAGGTLKVYETGLLKGNFGAYAVGDALKVAVEGGVVRYYRNSSLVYTSSARPIYPLLMDTSINSSLGRVVNASICGTNMQRR